jgi:hypothetical protein
MPANVLQKNQSYPDLGYRIDGKGIAYDLQTNQPLSRQEVDARIARLEDIDPSSNDYAERESKRGGIAGLYDRNKAAIPALQTALAMVPGIGPLISAGIGGLRGFDREGEGGIGYDVGTGLKGAATGYGAGMAGNALAGGLGKGLAAFKTAGGGLSGVKAAGSSLIPSGVKSLMSGGADGGEGGSGKLGAADWLKAVSGAVGAGLDYKTKQGEAEEDKNRYARDTATKEGQIAVGAQDRINRAPMADNAQALLMARMGGAPTTFAPRDFTRQGMSQATMQAPARGGPQDALASARTAAANYQPGQGGVDTSVLELLKKRMLANSGMAG